LSSSGVEQNDNGGDPVARNDGGKEMVVQLLRVLPTLKRAR
jgi:hypothetical protein